MMKYQLLISYILFISVLDASNIIEKSTYATASSKKEACEIALLNAKKDALEWAGVSIKSELNILKTVENNSLSSNKKSKITQFSNGIIKVLNKKIQTSYNNKTGLITCYLNAKFNVEVTQKKENNFYSKCKYEKFITSHDTVPSMNNYISKVILCGWESKCSINKCKNYCNNLDSKCLGVIALDGPNKHCWLIDTNWDERTTRKWRDDATIYKKVCN